MPEPRKFPEQREIARQWRAARSRAFLWFAPPAVVFLWAILRSREVIPSFPGVDDRVVSGVGYLVLFLSLFLLRRSLRCPACRQSVWPPRANVCPHCGGLLVEGREQMSTPSGNVGAASPLVESKVRTELASRLRIFVTLARMKRLTYVFLIFPSVAVTAWLATAATASNWWVPLFAGAITYAFGWFFLVNFVYAVTYSLLWTLRARCPSCGTPFPRSLNVVPGHLLVDSTVPDHCTGCGCRFRE